MKALLTAQQINKTDRNDARGIAQMMRVLFEEQLALIGAPDAFARIASGYRGTNDAFLPDRAVWAAVGSWPLRVKSGSGRQA